MRALLTTTLLVCPVVGQVYPKELELRPGNRAVWVGNEVNNANLVQAIDNVAPTTVVSVWHRSRYETVPAQRGGVTLLVTLSMSPGCMKCADHYNGSPSPSKDPTVVLSGPVQIGALPSAFTRGEGASIPEPWSVRYLLQQPYVTRRGPLNLIFEFPGTQVQKYPLDVEEIDQSVIPANGLRVKGPTQGVEGTGCVTRAPIPTFYWNKTLGHYLEQVAVAQVTVDFFTTNTSQAMWFVPSPFGPCGSVLDASGCVAIPFTQSSKVPVYELPGEVVTQRVGINAGAINSMSHTGRARLAIPWLGGVMPSTCADGTARGWSAVWWLVPVKLNG